MHAQQHVLQHGEIGEQADLLEGASDADGVNAVRGEAGDVGVLEAHPARVRRHESGEAVEQGGLASAVGADDADDLALGHVEGDVRERPQAAILFADALDLQKGHGFQAAIVGGWSASMNRSPLP